MKNLQAEIKYLDHRGLGVADHKGQKLFVPFTHAETTVNVQIVDRAKEGIYAEHVDAVAKTDCPHFGTCGACLLQHLSDDEYLAFKQSQLENALKKFQINSDVAETFIIPAHTRRRVSFKVQRTKKKGVHIGYYGFRSHKLVNVDSCLVLNEELEDTIAFWKEFLEHVLLVGDRAELHLTLCENGIDAYLTLDNDKWEGSLGFLNEPELIAKLESKNVIRLNVGVEKQLWAKWQSQERTPYVTFADIKVPLSAKGFLQASTESEVKLTELLLENIADEDKVIADLFSGRGTFSIPLAKLGKKVKAYEFDDKANEALTYVASENGLSIDVIKRQLFTTPLKADDFETVDTIVLDPPRTGAHAQALEIAKSDVNKVIYVSCNPQTFARDAKEFVRKGYEINKIYAVDQFIYSSHVEVVAVFTKV